jgi:hypothetical protein
MGRRSAWHRCHLIKAQFERLGLCAYLRATKGTLSSMAASRHRPGRNEPCVCGSGRKYKQCCLERDQASASAERARAATDAAAQAPETGAPAVTRGPKHQTAQPWKQTTSRGFIPRVRAPRKVGSS